ncbi:hypothetical protein [Methanoregula sp.]|uniref:hypothetical protein n=1 Tax=Methanoregula sp. TaxID=2052170 RepID=UPI00236D3A50|nr:hypothetical protein [Methanoregula sp.]MDD1685650.1 hypothetical protein [Methanoregula sp.]
MKKNEFLISLAFFSLCIIIVTVGIMSIPPAENSPLWVMMLNSSGNNTTYSTAYNENQVSESFGVGIFPGPVKQNKTTQTALRTIASNESFEGYLWVNNQMTTGNDFLIFGLLDYQQIPFEFNNSGTHVHHVIHMAPFEESFYHFRIPPMNDGSHDFELFLVMKPDVHSLNNSFRLSTDQALLGSRRVNIIAGNTTGFSAPHRKNYEGPTQSCGSDYVLNDGLLLTTKPCDTKALLSANVTPNEIYDYSINIAADDKYPVSVAVIPLLDYYQVPLANNMKENVAFFDLGAGKKLAVPANVLIPQDEGVHELMLLWIPQPYISLDEDSRSVKQYHQWATSEPSIRVGLDVRSDHLQTPPDTQSSASVERADAVAIALNDRDVQDYLRNGYTIGNVGPLCYERSLSDRKIYKSCFTGVEFNTPDVFLIVYVDLKKGEVNETSAMYNRNPVVPVNSSVTPR